jgi:hypothetical protein
MLGVLSCLITKHFEHHFGIPQQSRASPTFAHSVVLVHVVPGVMMHETWKNERLFFEDSQFRVSIKILSF